MLNPLSRQTNRQTERRSNFELLRVAAMFMIVVFHIVCVPIMTQLTDASSIARLNNGWFNYPIFYKRLFLLSAICTWGATGNGIFLLISGYFMLPKGKNVNLIKISKKLLFQLGFAAIVLVVGSSLVFRYIGEENYISLINIATFNSMSWFAGYYFIVIFIAALFLNAFLMRLDQCTFTTYLVVLFALTQFSWSVSVLEGIGSGLSIVATGIFLYSLGGYIRLYDPFRRIRPWAFFLLIGVIYALVYLSAYNTTQTKIEEFFRSNPDGTFYQTITGYENSSNRSIITIMLTVSMFEIFKRIRIPRIEWINFLGKSTFMVFLIHGNDFFYSLCALNDWITDLHNSSLHFLVKLFAWGGATFAVGVLAYALYLLTLKAFAAIKPLLLKKEKTM